MNGQNRPLIKPKRRLVSRWALQNSFSSLHTWERGLNRSTEQKAWAQFQESYIFPIIFLELFVALTPWWSPTLPVTILLLLPLFPLSLLLLVLILSLIPMPMPVQLSPLHTERNLLPERICLDLAVWSSSTFSGGVQKATCHWICFVWLAYDSGSILESLPAELSRLISMRWDV